MCNFLVANFWPSVHSSLNEAILEAAAIFVNIESQKQQG